MLPKRVSQKDQNPRAHRTLQILLSSLLLSAPQLGPQWCGWGGQDSLLKRIYQPRPLLPVPAPLPASLQMKLPMLTFAEAFANKPGQRLNIYTDCFSEGIVTILCNRHLILVQDEGRVDADGLCAHGRGEGKR